MPKTERPSILPSECTKVETGCGSIYITVGFYEGNPFEVFITRGHTGTCVYSMNEALGRSISIGLQHGVPLENYVKTLRGIQCEKPLDFPKDKRCTSCADGLAKVLSGYVKK